MWFKFPPGVDNISVNLQAFSSEHKDKAGGQYFRAPDHFAAQILDLPGFEQVPQPEGAPDDLAPTSGPEAENTERLAGMVTRLQGENEELRQGLILLSAERDDLKVKVSNLEAEKKNLEADLEDAEKEITGLKAAAKKASEPDEAEDETPSKPGPSTASSSGPPSAKK